MSETVRGFNIEVEFLGGLTSTQQAVFESAAGRWSQIITADVPPVEINGRRIDDCLITAAGAHLDGPTGILGQAGPLAVRSDTLLPVLGMMEFDRADLARMETDGSLAMVIFHEMGHVLGMGPLWGPLGLLRGAGSINPVFVGENAMREFGTLIGSDTPIPVPVENKGGPGTRDSHWREAVFGGELMTGILDPDANPVSRITIAAMQDMGYQISLDAADAFDLPSSLELAIMGVGAAEHPQGCMMAGTRSRAAGRAQSDGAERVQRDGEEPKVLWVTEDAELRWWRLTGDAALRWWR